MFITDEFLRIKAKPYDESMNTTLLPLLDNMNSTSKILSKSKNAMDKLN